MYRGKFLPVASKERGKIHSVFREQVKVHSRKPEISYRIIERLYPNIKKLEMYARRERAGWDAFGNEIDDSKVDYGMFNEEEIIVSQDMFSESEEK